MIDTVCSCDYLETQRLLDSGADANSRDRHPGEHGETALMLAVLLDKSGSIAQLLLERGADVNARDVLFGRTALMYGVHPVLLRYGADLDLKDDEGNTALWWAISRQNPVAVKTLLDGGCRLPDEDIEQAREMAENTRHLDSIAIWEMIQAAIGE